VWLFAAAFGLLVWDWRGWIAWFALGGVSHILADSLTLPPVSE
jgi:membrane-bound metal-dependent hydrolase YbcI (DUF457 family)